MTLRLLWWQGRHRALHPRRQFLGLGFVQRRESLDGDEAAGLSLDVMAYAAPQEHTRGQRRGEERPAMDHNGIVPPRTRLRDADGVG
jgi:hypothetical protein